MKGAFGRSVRGDSSALLTVSAHPCKLCVNSLAEASSKSKILFADRSLKPPLSSKSFVVATRLPSREMRRAVKLASVSPEISHQEEEIKAIRSRSRSTIRRVATDCTLPALIRGMTFFQSTGERRYPYRRSRTRRVSCASTKR